MPKSMVSAEHYNALKLERDELAARVERLEAPLEEFMENSVELEEILIASGARNHLILAKDVERIGKTAEVVLNESESASLLIHDSELVEQVRDGFESAHYYIPGGSVSPSRVYRWLDDLASDLHKQAEGL